MTPANIAGLAKAGGRGADCCDRPQRRGQSAGGGTVLLQRIRPAPAAGVEVNTAEEIHVLCYFKTVDTALEFGRLLYAALPEFPYDPAVWGPSAGDG